MSFPVHIRMATDQDADEILSTHVASIRGVCAKDYPPEVIEAWAGPKTADWYVKSLADGNAIFVAEVEERIVGFVELSFNKAEIWSFYLRPEVVGKGVGSQLLQRAEEAFVSHGIDQIQLNSTLTSVGFYVSRGFENHGPTVFKLKSGVEIACVKMTKCLTPSPCTRGEGKGEGRDVPHPSERAISEAPRSAPHPTPLPGYRERGEAIIRDLGVMPYRDAWKLQEETHERVHSGEPETILIVEHPPVITMGRRGELQGMPNLIASKELLEANGVELVQTDRGGDITFHGPGQIVVYPIIRLVDHKLTVGGYVHSLERAVISALARFNITANADPSAVGVWTSDQKIAAIGVRIRKGVSLHGIALNVTGDLKFFDLIIPCGLKGRAVTSMQKVLGDACLSMDDIKSALVDAIVKQVLT